MGNRIASVLIAAVVGMPAVAAAETFAELSYIAEWSHWATPSGHAGVFMSGVSYSEAHAPFLNIMMSGLAASGERRKCVQETSSGCRVVEISGPTAQELEMARAIAKKRPFGLSLRGYHESLGSDIDGLEADLGYASPEPEATLMAGVSVGGMRSNRNSAPRPVVDPGAPQPMDPSFSRAWLGGFMSGNSRWLSMRIMVGYWDRWIVLVEAGVKRQLGPVVLGAGFVTDSYRPSRAGARATIGVWF